MTRDQSFITAVEGLLDAITYDDSGLNGKGGNGGLISRETIRKADELRLALHSFKRRDLQTALIGGG